MEIEVKYQTCLLNEALIRNINDNFESVSFEILDNGFIQTKIVLSEITELEEEYVDDLMAEFSAKQMENCVLRPVVEVGDSSPLKFLIYLKDS